MIAEWLYLDGSILKVEAERINDTLALTYQAGTYWLLDSNLRMFIAFAKHKEYIDKFVCNLAAWNDPSQTIYTEGLVQGRLIKIPTEYYISICDQAKVNLPVG